MRDRDILPFGRQSTRAASPSTPRARPVFAVACLALLLAGCGVTTEEEEGLPVCGDGVRQGHEICNGDDLGGITCESLGFAGGRLACLEDCSGFDTTACEGEATCGDGVRQGDEACDGADLGGSTCESLGFVGGELSCLEDCSGFDVSGCDGCGNGRVDPGETHENCCVDVGCPEGVCDPAAMSCVDPWEIECPPETAGACSVTAPWFCPAQGLPEYDCARCGCPAGTTCHEGFCYEPEVLAAERDDPFPRIHLPLERYFELYDELMTAPAVTFDDLSARLDALLREDARRRALMLGESHGSADEQAIAVQLMRDLLAAGWTIPSLGIEANTLSPGMVEDMGIGTFQIDGDLTNDAYCAAAEKNASAGLNHEEGVYVQYTGSGHASRETAHHDSNWIISVLPHAAECVARKSRKAITVITFDPAAWLFSTDRDLTWRLGNYFDDPDRVTAEIEAGIARWWLTMDAQAREPSFDTVVNGREVNTRVVEAATPDVFFAYLPRPERPAYFLESYQVLWGEAPIRDFLFSNQIQPGNCSMSWNLTPGEEEIGFFCNKDGTWLSATVDATTFTLVTWDTSTGEGP